jgi:phospholipid/cholesterol/gamma-HCH transport system substrate-binding protein
LLGYERIEKIQNVTVGIFVILGLLALGWLIFKFNDFPATVTRLNSYEVSVQFATAPGAQKDTPVRFCGYQIGRVTAVFPPQIMDELRNGQKTGKRFYQCLVIMSINKQYNQIPANVEVKLMTRGYGSSYLDLVSEPNLMTMPFDANIPEGGYLRNGMVVQGQLSTSNDIFSEETQKKLDELLNGLIVAIKNTNDIIGNAENKENLKQSLENLSKATAQATSAIKDFQTFMVSANHSSEELSKIMASIRQIVEKVESGGGTLGKVVNDSKFYESLLENSRQLNSLITEMQDFVKKLKEKGVKVQL